MAPQDSHVNPFEETETSADIFVEEVDNFLNFTGAERPKPDSIFILVMGVTGSGKSTFISKCSGKKSVRVGHDLQSCTPNLSIISFPHPDNVHTIYLLDTPGFDDTNRSDIDILTHIAHYLSVSYANRIYISGIIFMHRISDNRVSGTTKRNIAMFKQLVGEMAYENTAIVTTMWWKGEERINARRERQLEAEEFRDVLDGGGRMFRYRAGVGAADDEGRMRKEALRIVQHLVEKARVGPVVLRVQSEMVDEGLTLDQTAAGKVLEGDMAVARREFEMQLREVKKEMAEALQNRDMDAARTLRQVQRELTEKERKIADGTEEMTKTLTEMYRQEEDRLMGKMKEMEAQWRDALQKKEQEVRDMEESLQHLKAESEQKRLQDKEWQEIEVHKIRTELEQLRHNIRVKELATIKVKEGFGNSVVSGLGKGLASGLIGIAIPAITAGTFCCVM